MIITSQESSPLEYDIAAVDACPEFNKWVVIGSLINVGAIHAVSHPGRFSRHER